MANQFPKSITFLFKTWHAKFWNVTLFCNSMFPSLDNDCIIQDLAFQVLNPFGVINFSIRPKKELCFSWLGFPRHEHKKMIVKTWQTNFRNLSFFVQDLACQVLKCYIDLQIYVPKSWQWLHYSRLGFPSLEFFWGNYFHDPRKNYVFMTWFSNTRSQENDCQDLADQFPKSITFLIQDLACQVLKCDIDLQVHVS